MKNIVVLAALLLSACCSEDTQTECTQSQIADTKARNAPPTPQFVAEQDNVRVYRIWTREPHADDHWTYFTTPCGDVSAEIEYLRGKSRRDIPANVNGTGCRP